MKNRGNVIIAEILRFNESLICILIDRWQCRVEPTYVLTYVSAGMIPSVDCNQMM